MKVKEWKGQLTEIGLSLKQVKTFSIHVSSLIEINGSLQLTKIR